MTGADNAGSTGTPSAPESASFAVDTGLLRELGELLVGRDSTALAELIKNAYDADASFVRVHGYSLDNPSSSLIEVHDDGTGITLAEFRRGFLRVAGKSKDTPTRRSPVYGRRFTGQKGIGRLAAHKLASLLEVRSRPNRRESAASNAAAIEALIDWDKIEEHETLDDTGDAIILFSLPAGAIDLGTTLRLSRLRKPWRDRDRQQFYREATSLTPPDLLANRLPRSVLSEPLLFPVATVRDVERASDPGFTVQFSGDFVGGESMWDLLSAEIEWVLELRCNVQEAEIELAPSIRTAKEYPAAERVRLTIPHTTPYPGPSFEARIVTRRGTIPVVSLRNFAVANAGIRVYMEGFRVLPYGDVPRDDWLSIAQRYVARTSHIPGLDIDTSGDDESGDRPGLTSLPPQNVYGAVFLTERGAPGLDMLVNREGFVPNEPFDALVSQLTSAINILTRERAAATREHRTLQRKAREQSKRQSLIAATNTGGSAEGPTTVTVQPATVSSVSHPPERRDVDRSFASGRAISELMDEVTQVFQFAREQLALKGPDASNNAISLAEAQLNVTLDNFRLDFGEDLSLLRTLASIGTQLTIFAHEVRGLVGGISAVEAGLISIKNSGRLRGSPESKRLNDILVSVDGIRRSLERQTAYLSDAISLDARRRRSAQRVADVFDRSISLLGALIEREQIIVSNDLPRDMRTPPMFRAELQAVFTNLLTNAIKATGANGSIRAHADATTSDERAALRIENTGKAVDLCEAERWFQPFQSTSSRPDAILGQGIGLGLPITRSILEQYNGSVGFVAPSDTFATAIRISFLP